ncbi:hypothetical protein Ancab_007127 [Ancistrocladus abbreviatus]
MAAAESNPVKWEEIELSESYLVSSMYDKAAALASSALMRLCENEQMNTGDCMSLHDMMESAAMVLVQSSNGSGRASELLDKLKMYFGSVTRIPVQVVLSGACIQVSGGFSVNACVFLEDFLMKWKFSEGKYCAATNLDTDYTAAGGPDGHPVLQTVEYLEVVEFFAVTLLGTVLNDLDHAIFWVEKAQLPEEAQQDLLRRLRSLFSLKTSLAQSFPKSVVVEKPELSLSSLPVQEVSQLDKSQMALSALCPSGAAKKRQSILKWSQEPGRVYQCFSWFHNITIKFSNARFTICDGKVLGGCLILLICYGLRKKQDTIKRVARRKASLLKQAIVDLWQLAFSYQVNPLAAVQPLPAPTHRS